MLEWGASEGLSGAVQDRIEMKDDSNGDGDFINIILRFWSKCISLSDIQDKCKKKKKSCKRIVIEFLPC